MEKLRVEIRLYLNNPGPSSTTLEQIQENPKLLDFMNANRRPSILLRITNEADAITFGHDMDSLKEYLFEELPKLIKEGDGHFFLQEYTHKDDKIYFTVTNNHIRIEESDGDSLQTTTEKFIEALATGKKKYEDLISFLKSE